MDNPVFQKKFKKQTYGCAGEVRKLLTTQTGVTFLDEENYKFRLDNGALLKLYASPYTPSLGSGAFRYHPSQGHEFSIDNADIVITHGPPKGILEVTNSCQRAGCPFLFEAVARARPRMHCFGHIHESWGAKLVTWCQKAIPAMVRPDARPLEWGSETLFVNAAIKGGEALPVQPAWIVEFDLLSA
ncbi:uncharacterized protein N7496_009271 [Penicillium cataractarum]|uniref:Calcineurin-like phosphoesterase domain-containing protein n=1 Tax=Penicillium cataractarum TaxID=2100454 RepID=A0A9W9RNP1_9EURO|nr:uncharacterized protein N7496_009271 [Penicillium cataractarum]KAJ5363558.1 hypothetical protein N7496_009271 [Penicillium cataractarum]